MTVSAVLVFDFDGTLYRGTAACRHYAEGIAATLEPERREAYLEALDRYLAGDGGIDAADGWEAAVLLAGGPRGASRAYAEAFARTREFMLGGACPLEVPDGLAELLARAAGTARRVLASNTPAFGVMPMLERLGLRDSLDEIVCDSAKPRGFAVRLRAYADMLGLPPEAVLSIGDHFPNDIEPALAAGCRAAYVNPFGVGPAGRADFEAPTFEELLEPIEAWLESPLAEAAV